METATAAVQLARLPMMSLTSDAAGLNGALSDPTSYAYTPQASFRLARCGCYSYKSHLTIPTALITVSLCNMTSPLIKA